MKAFLGRYELVSNERLAEYADAVRLGYRSRKVLLAATPVLAFAARGGAFSMEVRSSIDDETLHFALGEAIDQTRSDGASFKTTFEIADAKLVQRQRGHGIEIEATVTHAVAGDTLTATHACNGVVCVRTYRRLRGPDGEVERG